MAENEYLIDFLIWSSVEEEEEEEEEECGDAMLDLSELEDEDDEDGDLQQALLRSVVSSNTRNIGELQLQEVEVQRDLKKKGLDRSCRLLSSKEDQTLRANRMKIYPPERGEPSHVNCVICKDYIPTRLIIRSQKCAHAYCEGCIGLYLGEKVQEDIARVTCPESECGVVLELEFCRRFVPEEVFDRWVCALRERSVLALPMYIQCPLKGCGQWFVDDERCFKIRACPKCSRIFCVDCKVPWHMGRSCGPEISVSVVASEQNTPTTTEKETETTVQDI